MTYIVSSGALNSTQTKPNIKLLLSLLLLRQLLRAEYRAYCFKWICQLLSANEVIDWSLGSLTD